MPDQDIPVSLAPDDLALVDEAVESGQFGDRSEAIRYAVRHGLPARAEAVAESYRRAYGSQPEETWSGRVGLRLAADSVRRHRDER